MSYLSTQTAYKQFERTRDAYHKTPLDPTCKKACSDAFIRYSIAFKRWEQETNNFAIHSKDYNEKFSFHQQCVANAVNAGYSSPDTL